MEWQAAQRGATSVLPWWLSDFKQLEQSCYDKLPDLREVLKQARQARMPGNILVQSVAPMPLLFATVRDLDCQRQQCLDQTLAKCQSSPLDGEQRKWAKTPLQPGPHDIPNGKRTRSGGREDQDRGCSRTRSKHRKQEFDRARSKSRACSKSHKCNKSCKCSNSYKHSKSRKCSKSCRRSKSRACSKHEVWKPGVWLSQLGRSQSKGRCEEDRSHQSPSSSTHASSHSYEQMRSGWHAKHLAPSNYELSKFVKLKEEVVK